MHRGRKERRVIRISSQATSRAYPNLPQGKATKICRLDSVDVPRNPMRQGGACSWSSQEATRLGGRQLLMVGKGGEELLVSP